MVTIANDVEAVADPTNTLKKTPAQFVPLWKPADVSKYQAFKFTSFVNKKYGIHLDNYFELHEWSCDKIEEFWASVWEYTGIIAHAPYTEVYEKQKSMDEIPLWFSGARLNYAENMIERLKDSDRIAIYSRGEQESCDISFKHLYSMVSKVACAFKKLGLVKGDRVAAYTTNCTQAVVGMLATASIGAIWSSSSVDFGVTAVTDRFSQIGPKIFISIDESRYNGKVFSHVEKINEIVKCLPSVENVVIIHTNKQVEDISTAIPGSMSWDSLFAIERDSTKLEYEMMSFNDPLYILFSSGTTGKPKCLVHRIGGILIQHKKELQIILDIGESDIFFYYTTTGWMMWNYLVSGLSVGASIVLYEGTPMGPSPGVLWELAEKLKFTVFGTSAKYIQYLEDVSYKPAEKFDLDSLKTILSTASPLKPNSYDYVYKWIKQDVLLGSISGGTDICSVFVGSCHTLPVYKGEITCPLLGMAIECWDSSGKKTVGVSGDMVCVKPFPCMPVYFWGDTKDHARYRSSYFEKFPGVWCQGDYMKINPVTKGMLMLGRSDGTLNPNGIRFGSAEIYNVVDQFDEVADSLVVGQQIDQNERVLLFLKLKDTSDGSGDIDFESVKAKISKKIRMDLSPRHVPAKIIAVQKIPYTTNSKKVEVAVKTLLNDCYALAEQYRALHAGEGQDGSSDNTVSIEQISEYVQKNVVIDRSKVVAVADFDSISSFTRIKEILY